MTNHQESTLASWDLIAIEFENYEDSLKTINAFYEASLTFRSNLKLIKAVGVDASKNYSGITDNKKETEILLNRHIIDNSGILQVYAHEKSDNELLKKINLNESKIKKQRQNKKIAYSGVVIEEIEKLTDADLARFDLKKEEIAEMKRLLAEFVRLAPAKRKADIDKSGHNAELDRLFKENSGIKKKILDKLIGLFLKRDPEFYRKYMAAKVVIPKKGGRKNNKHGDTNITTEEKK
jgi:hypothetical protein